MALYTIAIEDGLKLGNYMQLLVLEGEDRARLEAERQALAYPGRSFVLYRLEAVAVCAMVNSPCTWTEKEGHTKEGDEDERD
jgi:hypothetical protein